MLKGVKKPDIVFSSGIFRSKGFFEGLGRFFVSVPGGDMKDEDLQETFPPAEACRTFSTAAEKSSTIKSGWYWGLNFSRSVLP